ncbi:hypothetical protein M0R45_000321 [Rubus argutus]|uniref:Uncharacterized protein n=1 Tax=Rubus argutus TaxID=59490 RepID=A0AAW1VPM7_RUBAR
MLKLGSVVTTGAREQQRETSEWIGENGVARLTEVRRRRWIGALGIMIAVHGGARIQDAWLQRSSSGERQSSWVSKSIGPSGSVIGRGGAVL